LDDAGQPTGAQQPLFGGAEFEAAVLPVDGGFAVLIRRAVVEPRSCEAICSSTTCQPDSHGIIPHSCSHSCLRPCQKQVALDIGVQTTDLQGRKRADASWLRAAPNEIAAVTAAQHGSFSVATTGDEQLNVSIAPDGKAQLRLTSLPKADFLMPVRGVGVPSFLLLNEAGPTLLSDATGAREIGGDPFRGSARVLDSRPQARWAEDGTLHVVLREWMEDAAAIRYGTIAVGTEPSLRMDSVTSDARAGLRAPFALYVEPRRLAGGVFQRTTWLHDAVGEAIGLNDYQADIAQLNVQHDFSGSHFVFAYVAPEPAPGMLRTIAVDCRGP
jgi:hypothetical protein